MKVKYVSRFGRNGVVQTERAYCVIRLFFSAHWRQMQILIRLCALFIVPVLYTLCSALLFEARQHYDYSGPLLGDHSPKITDGIRERALSTDEALGFMTRAMYE